MYLSDFRKWVIENHQHIQLKEVEKMQRDVQHQVDGYLHEVFFKQLDKANLKSVFLTESKTILDVAIGFIPIASTLYSFADASVDTIALIKEREKYNKLRWSGLIVQTQEVGRMLKRENQD